ncbi:hypothetical protein GCM10010168_18480 [Actinoplanes ianthinogenes]|nr:hypothetical protein [Actinoplanes ianthinogenes]GGR02127.1 hypothetical protein GCM10010168_18480 [Actinoplanes ianthinogenes]
MMIRAVEERLVSMLGEAGVSPGAMTAAAVRTVVDVFQRFAALPVDDVERPEEEGDGVLAEFGTVDFRGRREFATVLTRQLIEPGDDASIWQLSCTLYWPSSVETEELGAGHLWSFGRTLDDFFAQAAGLAGWAWALKNPSAPRDLVIALEEV